jgi:nicotinic acetylcholine receptor, invertebrate
MDLKHINQQDQVGGKENNLVEMGINLKDYYPSVEWDILSVPAERHARYYECCPDEFYAGEYLAC